MTGIDRQAAFSGTKEVAPALAIDATRLADYLCAKASRTSPAR